MSNFESEQCKFELNNISALSFWPTTYFEKKLETFLSKKLQRDIHEIIPNMEKSNQMQIGENMNQIVEIFSPKYGKNILNLEEEINFDDLYFINQNKTKTISSIELQAFYLFSNPIKKLDEIYKVKKYDFPKKKKIHN
jgi:predicted membrane-bound dolichyl-phosphate-mannose-protein mannosyltransferase